MRLALALLAMMGLVVACERVVDLTPPDARTGMPDAAVSEGFDAGPDGNGGSDGNDAWPPDAAVFDAP